MPGRYLELEEQRLARHVVEWLQFEAARVAFEVAETEAGRSVSVGGLAIDLRLDRIDRLNDDSLLVIDYKTGDVTHKSWERPRPDDVQLPLYAGFALDREKTSCSAAWYSQRCAPAIKASLATSGIRPGHADCRPEKHHRAGKKPAHGGAARRLARLH